MNEILQKSMEKALSRANIALLPYAFRQILWGVLRAAFIAQILFGLLWGVRNFGSLPLFGDTAFQVMVSGTLACDDYTGILYPAVLLLVRAVFRGDAFRWYQAMYVIQLILAGTAGYVLLGALGVRLTRRGKIFGTLALLTFPMCLQCHLAILPNSFTLSFLMLEFAFLAIALKKGPGGKYPGEHLAGVCLFWLLLSLTSYEFLYIGAVPVMVLLFLEVKAAGKGKMITVGKLLLTAALFLGVTLCIQMLTQEKGLYERPERSLAKTAFDRTAWSCFLKYRWYWPELLTENVDGEILYSTSLSAENVQLLLEPALESSLGTEGAKEIYRTIATDAVRYYKKTLVHDIAIDTAAYLVPPVITGLLLTGKSYAGFAPRNYDVMKRFTPVLTKYYFDFGIFLFAGGLLIALLCAILDRRIRGKAEKIRTPMQVRIYLGTLLATALAMVLFYVMQGCNLQDYKQAIPITTIYLVLLLFPGREAQPSSVSQDS